MAGKKTRDERTGGKVRNILTKDILGHIKRKKGEKTQCVASRI